MTVEYCDSLNINRLIGDVSGRLIWSEVGRAIDTSRATDKNYVLPVNCGGVTSMHASFARDLIDILNGLWRAEDNRYFYLQKLNLDSLPFSVIWGAVAEKGLSVTACMNDGELKIFSPLDTISERDTVIFNQICAGDGAYKPADLITMVRDAGLRGIGLTRMQNSLHKLANAGLILREGSADIDYQYRSFLPRVRYSKEAKNKKKNL